MGYMDSSGSCSTLSAALIAVRACSNECVAVALSTCLVGLRSLEDLGPWAIVLGRNGQGWLESGSVGGFDDLHGSSISKPVPPNQWPAATASLGVVLWLEPSEGRDGHAREVGLAEARRCLRPDGLLLVAEGNGEGCYSSDSDDGALEGDESSGDEAGASVEVKTGRLLAMGYHVHNSGNANAQKLKSSDSQSNDASVPQRNKSAVNEAAKLKVVRRYLTSKGDAWCLVAALRSGTSGSAPASGAAEPSTEGRATDSSSASTATPAVVAEATVTTVVSAVAGLSLNADLAASAGRRSSQPSVAPAVAVSMPAPLAWAAAAGTPGVAVRAEQRLLEAAAAWSARRAWAHGSRLSVQTPPPAAEVCGWEQAPLPSFLDAHDVYPQLATLQTPANFEAIQAEARKVAETGWKDWPEQHYSDGGLQDWKVFPFVHTFPADDPSATTFIASTCAACPKTASLLKVHVSIVAREIILSLVLFLGIGAMKTLAPLVQQF